MERELPLYEAGRKTFGGPYKWGPGDGGAWECAIVDTQDGWQGKEDSSYRIAIEWDERPGEPKGPSDAEIVAAYERAQRSESPLRVDGMTSLCVERRLVPMVEVRAAWSRELQRLGMEAERAKRLPCEAYDELVGVDVEAEWSELCDPFAREWRQ